MKDWNAEQYLKFQKERTQPAVDLANRIQADHPENILDIGCGPGNSTAVLYERFPGAQLLGVDNSPDMLSRAQKNYPQLSFRQMDAAAEDWNLTEKFDIVFSNACIQWIPAHQSLLPRMMSVLKSGGVLAVQVPIQEQEPIHRIIKELSENPKWKNKFPQPRIFHTLTPEEYYDLLAVQSESFEMWTTTYFHRMKSHFEIIEWYRGTGLRPYLNALDELEQKQFADEIYEEVKKQYPVQKNGEVIFRFPRLFFCAVK